MLYKLLQILFKGFFSSLFWASILGRENIPTKGAVILAANHMSNWDPPLLAAYLKRPICYMAKQELFAVPVLGRIITSCHSFPIKRGGADRAAIKVALQIIKKGHCLGLFPEGTRSSDGKVHKAEAGIGLLAALSGAPVVPAAIINTDKIFSERIRFPRLKVLYGQPVYYQGKKNDKESLQKFSQEVMDKISEMKNNID